MNLNVKRSSNNVSCGSSYTRDMIARTAERIQRWFSRPAQEQDGKQFDRLLYKRLREEFNPCGIRMQFFVTGWPKALKPAVQEQVYLIVREAFANALRHSKATSIEAEVAYSPRRLCVFVRDNGCGIDPKAVWSRRDASCGLLEMRERAGTIGAQLQVWSRPGAGTEVEISVSPDSFADLQSDSQTTILRQGINNAGRSVTNKAMVNC
jgi:glucose-6-phosphate-specific signal transduction histidine kinase